MNVFEDLVVELKEENLLEQTVIDDSAWDGDRFGAIVADENLTVPDDSLAGPEGAVSSDVQNTDPVCARAETEVASLQMVQHVLTAVQRDHLKQTPQPFDEISVKAALYRFVRATRDTSSNDIDESAAELDAKINAWKRALLGQDNEISAAALRRYCENSKPALSPQAMFGLVRFYGWAPYSGTIREKYDFVVSRLFSQSDGDFKRVPLCGHDDMVRHLSGRHSDWRSPERCRTNDENPDAAMMSMGLQDLIDEANRAASLEDLTDGDIFGRLKLFKESCGELYFAPVVTASAIEANITLGNRLIDLVLAEREKHGPLVLTNRYARSLDQTVSSAISRTFRLDDIIAADTKAATVNAHDYPAPESKPKRRESKKQRNKTEASAPGKFKVAIAGVNRWLLAASLILVAASVGMYVWAGYFAETEVRGSNVQKLELEGSPLNEHLKTARISRETLYGVTQPAWSETTREKQEAVLAKLLALGRQKGYKRVQLINENGKAVAYAAPDRVEIKTP